MYKVVAGLPISRIDCNDNPGHFLKNSPLQCIMPLLNCSIQMSMK